MATIGNIGDALSDCLVVLGSYICAPYDLLDREGMDPIPVSNGLAGRYGGSLEDVRELLGNHKVGDQVAFDLNGHILNLELAGTLAWTFHWHEFEIRCVKEVWDGADLGSGDGEACNLTVHRCLDKDALDALLAYLKAENYGYCLSELAFGVENSLSLDRYFIV